MALAELDDTSETWIWVQRARRYNHLTGAGIDHWVLRAKWARSGEIEASDLEYILAYEP